MRQSVDTSPDFHQCIPLRFEDAPVNRTTHRDLIGWEQTHGQPNGACHVPAALWWGGLDSVAKLLVDDGVMGRAVPIRCQSSTQKLGMDEATGVGSGIPQ